MLFCPPVIVFHCVIIRIGQNLGWRLTQYHRFVNLSLSCVCVQGRRCVLKDCCKILDNTVLPPETVVPPFTVFSGCPGQLHHTNTHHFLSLSPSFLVISHVFICVYLFSLSGLFSGELPECTQDLMIDVTKSYYQKFLPLSQIWVLP